MNCILVYCNITMEGCILLYVLYLSWSEATIQIHLNTTQLSRNIYHFIHTSINNTGITAYST